MCVLASRFHTHIRESDGFSVCLRSAALCTHTHTNVLRAAGLCGQWYISLEPADPTGSPHSQSSRAGAYSKQAWKQTWNTPLCQQTNCPLAERERVWAQQAGEGAPTTIMPSRRYLSNKLNIISTERSGLSEQINPSSVFPNSPKIRHAYRASQGETVYRKMLPPPPLWANHQINPCLVSAKPKYANIAVIRVRAAKKLHCAQQRGNKRVRVRMWWGLLPSGAADEGVQFVVEKSKIKQRFISCGWNLPGSTSHMGDINIVHPLFQVSIVWYSTTVARCSSIKAVCMV